MLFDTHLPFLIHLNYLSSGLCQETGVEIGLYPEKGTISPQDPSHGQGGGVLQTGEF